MANQLYTFSMNISAEKCLRYYQGSAKYIVVTSDNGKTVRLPADAIQKFVTASGMHGRFQLEINGNNALVKLERLA
ncbi:MAG: DUF2835 domain-containing protein [Gammaproteobacteria bacterium]|nr:DUF2835 domain-containing protein [Gammaproteobacteria bacterium]